MSSSAAGNEVKRRVRVLRIVRADRTESVRETVRCPNRDQSISLETCRPCELLRGIEIGPHDGGPMLCCLEVVSRSPGDARSTSVGEVMSPKVVAVAADVGADAARRALLERSAGVVPVVDAGGVPIGVVSMRSLLARRPLRRRPLRAADVMTPVCSPLFEGAPVAEAARRMALEQVDGLPVVDAAGALVGVLTAADVATWNAIGAQPLACAG